MLALIRLNLSTLMHLPGSYLRRWQRLFLHFLPFIDHPNKLSSSGILEWIVDLFFYVLDVFFIPDLLEILLVYPKPNTRKFNKDELNLVRYYFGNSIKTSNLRINDKMSAIAQSYAHAFVLFHTIHYRDWIAKEIFIHELVHIWQYQMFGSVYIFRALKAQRSKEGYDYGSIENLYHQMLSQSKFLDFNFEQQGEICEDYARIIEYSDGRVSPLVLAAYEYFVEQVRN